VRRASEVVALAQARLRRTWDARRLLGAASELLEPILAQVVAQTGLLEAAGWVAQGTHLSGTQVVVMAVGPPQGPAAAIVKVPATADGVASQAREAAALAALGQEPGMGSFRDLIPARLAAGTAAGRPYLVERAIAGVDGRHLAGPAAERVVAEAAAVIGELHRRTSSPVVVDGPLLDRWIGKRLEVLVPATRDRACLDRVGTVLAWWWEGQRLPVSWVHGDFWAANVIFHPETVAVTGVIDWEWAGPCEPPAHDLLYLLIHARMLAAGREFGDVVSALLDGASWTSLEQEILEAGGVLAPGQARVGREVLLLVWLRHVAFNLIQAPGDARNWVWTGRNIDPVLRLA
jgi:aminoglycoside phosphotransferase (APT) family kinase protein